MMITISTIHDPQGIFLPLIGKVKQDLEVNFCGTVVAYTAETSITVIKTLEKFKLNPILGGLWGEARKKALSEALKSTSDFIFVCDFDKILHWLLTAKSELKTLLKVNPEADYLILGRSGRTMATYPLSWVKTESITSHLISKILGFPVDALTAAAILNRRSGEKIARSSCEASWGSCIEWPLIVHAAELDISYQEAKGLTWEDPDRFRQEIKNCASLNKWQQEKYDSFSEWERRISILEQQWQVVNRFS
ncbi:MAG TPA: hypothetical protein VMW41_02130 [Candidatus Bathyarchaeia archaeon]|nr:hypothetical protein [Candidatus Bathyarchaeia archaeon]